MLRNVRARIAHPLAAAAAIVAIAAGCPSSAVAGFVAGATPTPTNSSDPFSVAVGDFNGDGDQDLATANTLATGTVSILTGNGAGAFAAATPTATGGINPFSVAVGDFNLDGNQDLAVANDSSSGTVSILTGNGAGAFAAATPIPIGGFPHSVAVGDFNGDGYQDLATANSLATGSVSILTGNGAGGFTAAAPTATNSSMPISVAVGDFNGDGNQDLVTANETTPGSVSILTGNGAGVFTAAATPTATNGSSTYSVAVGDFNGDANQDLATANATNPGSVSILTGDGAGAFAAATPTPTNSSYAFSVAVGDFNGDGDQDLATTNFTNPGSVSILTGNGAGAFSTAAPTATNSQNPYTVAVGDFDGDGNEDLATSNAISPGTVSILRSTDPPPAGNLLANAGADAVGAAGSPPLPPGWTRVYGSFTQVRYGAAGGWLAMLDAPLWRGGNAYFVGGFGAALSVGSQVVDVAGSGSAIDAGLASIDLSALLGGSGTQGDNAMVSAQFLNAADGALGETAQIGPVSAAERHNITTLLFRSTHAAVPAGTRKIRVTITATREVGTYNEGSADELRLALTVAKPSNAALPVIAGTTTLGRTLSVTNGAWTNGPTSFARQWRRCNAFGNNCSNIAGATTSAYLLRSADVGHTLRVVVTASNAGGSTSATSKQTAKIAAPPLISNARFASASFTAKNGTKLKLTLSKAATVGVVVTRRVNGRKVNGKCKRKATTGKRCKLTVQKAKLSFNGVKGKNTFPFLLPKLKPRGYSATIRARDAGGRVSKPVKLSFTVK